MTPRPARACPLRELPTYDRAEQRRSLVCDVVLCPCLVWPNALATLANMLDVQQRLRPGPCSNPLGPTPNGESFHCNPGREEARISDRSGSGAVLASRGGHAAAEGLSVISPLAGAVILWLGQYPQILAAIVLLAAMQWVTPASARGCREWAVSVGPQLGYASVGHQLQGTVEAPGQFTMVDAAANSAGTTLGLSAALAKRFWSESNQVAWGLVGAFSYANAANTRLTVSAEDPNEQAAMDDLAAQLHPDFTRLTLQGGLGLTLLGGRLEARVLAGGELSSVSVPEFSSSENERVAALAANLGVRLRLPFAERWVGYAGGNCGASKHPLVTGYSTSCMGELGLEWRINR